MHVCVTVHRVWTKSSSVDNRTQSTTQWIALTHHTQTHTQIPEFTDEKQRHSEPTSQWARACFTAATMEPVNGAVEWLWEISELPCQDLHHFLTNLHPLSLNLFLFCPTSFFPGWISQWLKVARRGHWAQSTSHSLVYESLHCGCALFLTLFSILELFCLVLFWQPHANYVFVFIVVPRLNSHKKQVNNAYHHVYRKIDQVKI